MAKKQNNTQLNNNIFIDIKNEVMSKDCLINMLYSARGIGKTYGALKYAIENYETTGYSSIYLRRFKSELKKFSKIFNPLLANNEIDLDKYQVDVKNKKLIDKKNNKDVIMCQPLSISTQEKSVSYNEVNFVIFDEFIIDKSTLHYIPEEFALFNNFIETVARLGELTENRVVKVLMLANAGNRNNPYFIGYNIPVVKDNIWIKDDLLLMHPVKEGFKKAKESTRWGKFLKKHTKMEGYMFDGEFKDKKDFIANIGKKTRYIGTLIYLQKYIGLYIDDYGIIYISDKINKQSKVVYALTKEDNTPNILLLNSDNRILKYIKKAWEVGQLRFTDLKLQAIFLEILKII